MAPGANLIVLKVFENDSPSGGNPGVDINVLEQALNWIEAHVSFYNIVTVNLSIQDSNYTTPFLSSRVHDEFQRLTDAGVICVAASGNEYRMLGSGVAYPAADPFVLAVGSVWDGNYGARTVEDATDNTTAADRVSGYSQRHSTMTDILAPGGIIVGARDGGGFLNKSGTSMAAPFVSGAVLLAQQLAQREMSRFLTFDEFRTLIRDTAVMVNDGDDENYNVTATGANYPRLNIFAMAEALLNNPGPPSISVTDATVSEGDTGTKIVEITVQLTRAATTPITVQYATADGTATLADADYVAASNSVTIDAGQTSRKLQFTINADKGVEPDETFVVNFSNPSGGVLADNQAVITITNDDFIRLWQNPARGDGRERQRVYHRARRADHHQSVEYCWIRHTAVAAATGTVLLLRRERRQCLHADRRIDHHQRVKSTGRTGGCADGGRVVGRKLGCGACGSTRGRPRARACGEQRWKS